MKIKKWIIGAILLSLATPALADEWGCQVLLCLSNPGGPTEFAECVPPIEKLWAALSKIPPDPFPTCPEAGAGNEAHETGIHYDVCPGGTAPATVGAWVAQGSDQYSASAGGMSEYDYQSGTNLSRACVAGFNGTFDSNDPNNGSYILVNLYQSVTWLAYNPHSSIDVIINGSFYKRIFW